MQTKLMLDFFSSISSWRWAFVITFHSSFVTVRHSINFMLLGGGEGHWVFLRGIWVNIDVSLNWVWGAPCCCLHKVRPLNTPICQNHIFTYSITHGTKCSTCIFNIYKKYTCIVHNYTQTQNERFTLSTLSNFIGLFHSLFWIELSSLLRCIFLLLRSEYNQNISTL